MSLAPFALLAGESLSRHAPRPRVFQLPSTSTDASGCLAAKVELGRGARRVSRGALKWGHRDSAGLLQHVAELPPGTLEAGRYELRVTCPTAPTSGCSARAR